MHLQFSIFCRCCRNRNHRNVEHTDKRLLLALDRSWTALHASRYITMLIFEHCVIQKLPDIIGRFWYHVRLQVKAGTSLRCSRLLLCPVLLSGVFPRLPFGGSPRSFFALEKRLYLREQDTGQGLRLIVRHPGAIVVDFLVSCRRSRPLSKRAPPPDFDLCLPLGISHQLHSPRLFGRSGRTTKLTSAICSIRASASCASLYSSSSRYRGMT